MMIQKNQHFPDKLRNIRISLCLGFLSLFLLIGFLLMRDRVTLSVSSTSSYEVGGKADVKIEQAKLFEAYWGVKEWELNAEAAETFTEQQVTELKNMRLTMTLPDQRRMTISANKGRVAHNTKEIEAEGNIVISGPEYTIFTEALRWTPAKKEFENQEFVRLVSPHMVVTGYGLSFHPEGAQIEILKNVEATFSF
ncbi:MAG: LPS export ABC transporter periplasmic protein LptC [Candidatus Tectomicrobia bacterium]|nr:LPS export ABC transporter periplasmic protein LptC [Candidatus Tectomicrobia bacterium]